MTRRHWAVSLSLSPVVGQVDLGLRLVSANPPGNCRSKRSSRCFSPLFKGKPGMGFDLSRIWSVRFRPDRQSRCTNHPQTPVGASAAREALAPSVFQFRSRGQSRYINQPQTPVGASAARDALALAPQPSLIDTTAALIITPTVALSLSKGIGSRSISRPRVRPMSAMAIGHYAPWRGDIDRREPPVGEQRVLAGVTGLAGCRWSGQCGRCDPESDH